ncbi:MAG: integrase DNA-binding domain-containing protein [Lachnospiraceae bacterium]|nr:integrase DNA-binding domain-containing protein [Lachnospiraceae bacterium]
MSTRRKDHKGRVLKRGESQRNNLTYEYRYVDFDGKRRSVYAPTLVELRRKEEEIQRRLSFGDNYAAGEITAMEMVEYYLSTKQGVRQSTKIGYQFVLGVLRKEEFATRKINTIKVSDVKRYRKGV